MYSNKRIARIVGVLFIIGTVAGVLRGVVTLPILNAPDYLITVATNANQIGLGVILPIWQL